MKILLALCSLVLTCTSALGTEPNAEPVAEPLVLLEGAGSAGAGSAGAGCLSEIPYPQTSSVFYRYADALNGMRESSKETLVVLFDDSGSGNFSNLYDIALNMEESLLASFVNFLVICPPSSEELYCVEVEKMLLQELADFKSSFSSFDLPSDGTYVITIARTSDGAEILDMSKLPFLG